MAMEMTERIRARIEGVAKHIEILQVTGEAAQNLLRPDDEEVEDRKRIEADPTLSQNMTCLFESPAPARWSVVLPTPPLSRLDRHLFQFFLDGSVHARALGTGLEGQRSFPVGLFQIGAAAVRRDDAGHLFPCAVQHRVLLTIPAGAGGISDTMWEKMAGEGAKDPVCHVVKIESKRQGRHGRRTDADDMRLSSSAVAYGHMHNLEGDLCAYIEGVAHTSSRIILDGSVQFGRLIRNPFVIGVAKSFWNMPALQLQDSRVIRINLTEHLARLPLAHRTTVFEAHKGDVGFWYIRLRPARQHPLEGVVKVELPRPQNGQCVEAEEATFLSRALVAERTVATFGLDHRWPSLLYPIHHAERLIKRGFVSEPLLDRLIQSVMHTIHH
jgi:hypothetical protein